MRRVISASVIALLITTILPLEVVAAAPDASAAPVTTNEDVATPVVLGASDTDGDATTSFEIATAPTHGALGTIGAITCEAGTPNVCSASVTYTPDPDFFGSDSFTFTANDGNGPSAEATAAIIVDAVNDAPAFTTGADVVVDEDSGAYSETAWAIAISAGPGEDQALTFTATPADPSLFAIGPAISASGTLTLTPATNANGSTVVTVTLRDDGGTDNGGEDTSASQSFQVDITAVNDAPDPSAAPVTTLEQQAATITLTGSDVEGDATTAFAIATAPAKGILAAISTIDCDGLVPNVCRATVEYTPILDANGADSFTFTATDGTTVSSAGTASLTITNVNDPVVAKNDTKTITATRTTAIPVLANDSAGPNESISTVTITTIPTKPTKGSATITGTTVTYNPTGCSTGNDLFTYTISDGEFSATASVVVTIARPGTNGLSSNPITDAPASAFITNSTMGTTVPVKVSWCGVTRSGYSVRSYRLQQSVNGGTYSTLISATTATSSTRSLSVSPKTYRFRVRTVDNAGRTGAYVYTPTFKVSRVQDTSSAITYSTGWSVSSNANASGGTEHYTSTGGKFATYTFTGRAFAIVGPKSATRGSFKVYVGADLVATVSEKATTGSYRRVLYTRAVTSGTHTVRIVAVGNGRIDLDAILVMS